MKWRDRYTTLIVLLFTVTLFVQCANNNRNRKVTDENNLEGCDTVLTSFTVSKSRVKLFRALEPFYNFLDTIVESEKKCLLYDECMSGFVLSKFQSEMYPIGFSSINIYTYDYSKCIGVFMYRGRRFVCDNIIIPELIVETSDSIDVKYFYTGKTDDDWDTIDDTGSAWYFNFENSQIILKGHYACPGNVPN